MHGAAGWVTAAKTSTQRPPRLSVGFNSNFSIADFDGDRKPDLATVEIQEGSSGSSTRYSIRLQLTAGAEQVFGVTAPAGGLLIVARDVNGDNALDVLVSTVWQHKQVAVLLNDGHGNFTLADPGAFPDFAGDSQEQLRATTVEIHDNAAMPSSGSSGKASGVCAAHYFVGDEAELAYLSDFRFHIVQLAFGSAGRAPPFTSLHI